MIEAESGITAALFIYGTSSVRKLFRRIDLSRRRDCDVESSTRIISSTSSTIDSDGWSVVTGRHSAGFSI
jgi:hypothetical protein